MLSCEVNWPEPITRKLRGLNLSASVAVQFSTEVANRIKIRGNSGVVQFELYLPDLSLYGWAAYESCDSGFLVIDIGCDVVDID